MSSKRFSIEHDVDLALVWGELVGGTVGIAGGFFSDLSCGLWLSPPRPGQVPLTGRRRAIIEMVLSGSRQNCVGIDLDLAASTIAFNARQALETIGVCSRPSLVHPLMILMATAARRGLLVAARAREVTTTLGDVRELYIARPGRRLADYLPKAEREVANRLLEGASYLEIARARKAAPRTVANQIAAVFRRLRVSGRSDFVQRLFEIDGLIPRDAFLSSPVLEPKCTGSRPSRSRAASRTSSTDRKCHPRLLRHEALPPSR